MADSFDALLPDSGVPDRTLAVVGDDHPRPVIDIFEEAFGSLDVRITETEIDVEADDAVVLIEDDDVVATSSMESIRNAVLLVNSDLYTTGLSGIESYEAPDILTELDDAAYTLRGFPASTKEKLLLIVISRHIERRALEADDGRLDVAFQKLSRIEDEYGTGRIYGRLSESNVDVHAYGVPDSIPTGIERITIHAGRTERYRRSWFVVLSAPNGRVEPAGLLAVEIDPNVWRATWTYDPDKISEIRRWIGRHF
jgi:hypothetical protein